MKNRRNLILITGAHRSGTSFVGKILSLPKCVGQIYEPFNKKHGIVGVNEWFPYVTFGGENETHYTKLMNQFLTGKTHFKKNNKQDNRLLYKISNFYNWKKRELGYRTTLQNPIIRHLIIKDPLAAFCSEWLHRSFGISVLILVRHPAAFIGSLSRMGWRHNFSELTKQTKLLDDHLGKLLDPAKDYSKLSFLEEGCLLWNCIYQVLSNFIDRNPSMLVKTHEQISLYPVKIFQELYGKFGFEFSHNIEKYILETTGSKNPVDPEGKALHTMKRNSAANIKRWIKLFDKDEIKFIRSVTEPLSSKFYSDKDWC